jgi:acetyltransferase-like isoleucine patch superfamily enzyme
MGAAIRLPLGDNSKTSINAPLIPGFKVGTNRWIGANYIVQKDIPADNVMLLKQDEKRR